ncbi:hypothetical protein KOI35_04705 [Actinoplanes bogorensis]|uniref:Uncharacterized protein n=1 Tax=Paractinoplanes bogorensis TaxID=1610840 RepID=A0ABS5YH50_9ACTN|nr:hypothetical protein [Actinoplanes bogorensis]MBU2662802.1 hypothetical protein [Actinoplanes bogorensis]
MTEVLPHYETFAGLAVEQLPSKRIRVRGDDAFAAALQNQGVTVSAPEDPFDLVVALSVREPADDPLVERPGFVMRRTATLWMSRTG